MSCWAGLSRAALLVSARLSLVFVGICQSARRLCSADRQAVRQATCPSSSSRRAGLVFTAAGQDSEGEKAEGGRASRGLGLRLAQPLSAASVGRSRGHAQVQGQTYRFSLLMVVTTEGEEDEFWPVFNLPQVL